MGLDYVDLYLAHWPLALKATSRAGLEKARAGQNIPLEEQGTRLDPETGKEIVDFEYSSKNLGEVAGKLVLSPFLRGVLFTKLYAMRAFLSWRASHEGRQVSVDFHNRLLIFVTTRRQHPEIAYGVLVA